MNLRAVVLGTWCVAGCGGFCASANGAAPGADMKADSAAQRDQRMARWREARFGLFIHWGLYAGPGIARRRISDSALQSESR